MGKLRTLSGSGVCRILRQHDFVKVRQEGSHVSMQKQTEGSTITIPVPMHKELKVGTLSSIIRQSGIPREVFES